MWFGAGWGVVFADPTLDLPKSEKQELEVKGVYRVGEDGSLKLLIKDSESAQRPGVFSRPEEALRGR
jgi:hypothetical protein